MEHSAYERDKHAGNFERPVESDGLDDACDECACPDTDGVCRPDDDGPEEATQVRPTERPMVLATFVMCAHGATPLRRTRMRMGSATILMAALMIR
ncbi:MAG: hypothetical protein ACI9OJ_005737 [Myxococcota bacterium]|jgi:hypothetical protein